MKQLFTILAFCLSLTANAQWTTMNIPAEDRYDDVYFLNDTLGWAVSSSGKILKTSDGETWNLSWSTGKYTRSIEFATPMLGFAGSLDSSFYRTTDGGDHWTDIADLIVPKPPGICGISAPTPNVIYGCGIWSTPAYVVKSEDGGDSWTSMDLSAYASALVDIYFVNADTGFVSGMAYPASDGGIILYTNDGGDTWTVKHKTMTAHDYVWKIQSPDGVNYFASVEALPVTDNVRMVKSTDSGATWQIQQVFDQYSYIQMIGFINSQRGWTGGSSTIFESLDGGDTWAPLFMNGSTYNRFFKINENLAYMTGEKIYKLDETGAGLNDQPHNDIHTLTVSPNPTEDDIHISVEINSKTYCQLHLFNARGEIVKTILDENCKNAKKQYTISLAELPAQTLYLVLKTNEGMIYRTIIKQ